MLNRANIATAGLCLVMATGVKSASLDGDVELLRLVAEAQRNNQGRIQTWSGSAHFENRNHGGAPQPNAPSTYEHIADISFVEDRIHDVVRSNAIDKVMYNRTTEQSIAQSPNSPALQGMSAPSPTFRSAMAKTDGYYRIEAPVSQATSAQLVIRARNSMGPDWRGDGVFSPMDFQRNSYQGMDCADMLLTLYTQLKATSSDAKPTKVLRQVTRDNNYVVLTRKSVDGTFSETLKFDLSAGGSLVALDAVFPGTEIHTSLEYEERDGVFLLRGRNERRFDKPGSEGQQGVSSQWKYTFETAAVNQPVDEAEFSLEKLGVKKGMIVVDRRRETTPIAYIYSGVSSPDRFLTDVLTGKVASRPASMNPASQPTHSTQVHRSPDTPPAVLATAKRPATPLRLYGLYIGLGLCSVILLVSLYKRRGHTQ